MQRTFQNVFKNTLTAAPMLPAVDVPCPVGVFSEIGRYTLSAGEALQPGFGGLVGLEAAPGRIYINLTMTGGEEGNIRVDLHDERDYVIGTVYEGRTEDLVLGAADRSLRKPFPAVNHLIGPDQALVVKLMPDDTDVVEVATTAWLIDVTSMSFRGGK